jgi:hypothetical protein
MLYTWDFVSTSEKNVGCECKGEMSTPRYRQYLSNSALYGSLHTWYNIALGSTWLWKHNSVLDISYPETIIDSGISSKYFSYDNERLIVLWLKIHKEEQKRPAGSFLFFL